MDKPWKVIFAFVGVFIAGAIFGGLFTLRSAGRRFSNLPPPTVAGPVPRAKSLAAPPIGVAMMRQFTQKLKLTADQKEKIRPIVTRAGEDLARLRRENLQATTRVMERMHVDIAASLTPVQRTELEEMRKSMQERVRAESAKSGDAPSGKVDGPRRQPKKN